MCVCVSMYVYIYIYIYSKTENHNSQVLFPCEAEHYQVVLSASIYRFPLRYCIKYKLVSLRVSLRGVVANVLDCNTVVSKFEL